MVNLTYNIYTAHYNTGIDKIAIDHIVFLYVDFNITFRNTHEDLIGLLYIIISLSTSYSK